MPMSVQWYNLWSIHVLFFFMFTLCIHFICLFWLHLSISYYIFCILSTYGISIFLLLIGNLSIENFHVLCRMMRSGLPSSKWCAPVKKLSCGAAYRNIMLWVDCSIVAVPCHQNLFFFQHIFNTSLYTARLSAYILQYLGSAAMITYLHY